VQSPNSPSALSAGFGLLSGLILTSVVGVALALALLGWAATTPTDPQGRSDVSGSDAAPRVVALLPFAADQLLALDVRPVAVPALRGEPPSAWDGIERVAMDHSAGPNLEQLIAARPDIIVTSSVYAQFVPAMERATGARVEIMDIDSVASVARHLERLGELVDRPDRAAARAHELLSDLPDRQAEADPVRVLAVFGTPHAFYAVLPDSYLGDLVERAGGELVTRGLDDHPIYRGLAPLSMETVMHHDPEQLIVIFHGPEETARAMLERDPLWSGLSAVRSGGVAYLADDLYAMRPGSELDRAMAEIEGIINEARDRRR